MKPVFVFIKCEMGSAYSVANNIVENIEETSELYSVSGDYDLLVKFYINDTVDIGRFVCERVQTTPLITKTHTLLTFNAFTS